MLLLAAQVQLAISDAVRVGLPALMEWKQELEKQEEEILALRQKLWSYEERLKAESEAAAEVKAHREFLESMNDRALKSFGIILALAAGVLTIVGVKSFSDITDKVQAAADAKVQRYLSEKMITSTIEERVNDYHRAAVIQYYLTESASREVRPALIPPDAVLEKVLESSLTVKNARYAAGCAKIIQEYDYFSNDSELRRRFGDLLQKLIVDSYGGDSVVLDDQTQVEIVNALAKLEHKEAGPALWKLVKDDRAPQDFRLAFSRKLDSFLTSDGLFQEIVSDLSHRKEKDRRLYSAELVAVLRLHPNEKVGLAELSELANDAGGTKSEVLITVLDNTIFEGKYSKEELTPATLDVLAKRVLAPLILGGKLYLRPLDDDQFVFRGKKLPPAIWTFLQTPGGGGTGTSSQFSTFGSPVFRETFKIFFKDPDTSNRDRFLKSMITPLLTGMAAYTRSNEMAPGNQAGEFVIDTNQKLPELKDRKFARLVLIGVSQQDQKVQLTAFPDQGQAPIHITGRISDIDFSKASYVPASEPF